MKEKVTFDEKEQKLIDAIFGKEFLDELLEPRYFAFIVQHKGEKIEVSYSSERYPTRFEIFRAAKILDYEGVILMHHEFKSKEDFENYFLKS